MHRDLRRAVEGGVPKKGTHLGRGRVRGRRDRGEAQELRGREGAGGAGRGAREAPADGRPGAAVRGERVVEPRVRVRVADVLLGPVRVVVRVRALPGEGRGACAWAEGAPAAAPAVRSVEDQQHARALEDKASLCHESAVDATLAFVQHAPEEVAKAIELG